MTILPFEYLFQPGDIQVSVRPEPYQLEFMLEWIKPGWITVEPAFAISTIASKVLVCRGNRFLKGELWKIPLGSLTSRFHPLMEAMGLEITTVDVVGPNGETATAYMYMSPLDLNMDNVFTMYSSYKPHPEKENLIEQWRGYPKSYYAYVARSRQLLNSMEPQVPRAGEPSGELEQGPID